jgi:hypothetical protein
MDARDLTPVERRSLRKTEAHHYYIPASYQAFLLLRTIFAVVPIVAGIDKFFHLLVNWNVYLAPSIPAWFGVSPQRFMEGVGGIEIAAGALVAARPRIGGWVVCAWLLGIVANLLSIPGFFDIAVRDLALAVASLALSRLSIEFQYYRGPGPD